LLVKVQEVITISTIAEADNNKRIVVEDLHVPNIRPGTDAADVDGSGQILIHPYTGMIGLFIENYIIGIPGQRDRKGGVRERIYVPGSGAGAGKGVSDGNRQGCGGAEETNQDRCRQQPAFGSMDQFHRDSPSEK
jgi:hypothetical protein